MGKFIYFIHAQYDSQYRFIALNTGIVAPVEMLDVSAMLVYNKHNKVARVLVSKPR